MSRFDPEYDFAPNEGETDEDAASTVICKSLGYMRDAHESEFFGTDLVWQQLTRYGFSIVPTRNQDESIPDVLSRALFDWLKELIDAGEWNPTLGELDAIIQHLTDRVSVFVWEREQ